MPDMAVYYLGSEIEILFNQLNQEEEMAWIISDGPQRWKAVPSLITIESKQVGLWHVPGGPLPLEWQTPFFIDKFVENPWEGWTEKRSSSGGEIPYFGPGHPNVFWLSIHPRSTYNHRLPESVHQVHLSWIGNYYWIFDSNAHASTQKWWGKMRRWIRKVTLRGKDEFGDLSMAFPNAHQRLTEVGVYLP